MFAEPQAETLRANFRGAKRTCPRWPLETGQDYGVPARSEWEQMATYNKLMGGKPLGGYTRLSQIMDGLYWTSKSLSPFNAVAVAPGSHISHRYIKSMRAQGWRPSYKVCAG